MIAYTAEYAGGELRPDPAEIEDARWFALGRGAGAAAVDLDRAPADRRDDRAAGEASRALTLLESPALRLRPRAATAAPLHDAPLTLLRPAPCFLFAAGAAGVRAGRAASLTEEARKQYSARD